MTDIAELDIRADSRDLERAKAALDGLTASAAKTEQATAGIRRGLDDAAQGATRARNALGQFTAAGDQSSRTFNDNAAAAAGFQRSVGSAAASVEQSIAAHVRAEAAAGKWNKALDETAGKSKAAAYQIQNVRAQLIDIAVGIQGGQNLTTIGFQQIPQILSAFGPGTGVRGVLSGVTESVVSLVRPLGLVGGGFATLAAAATAAGGAYLSFDSAQKDIAVGLTGLGKQSGIARDQIEALARGSDLATTDARKLATAFAATGNATSESIANALSRSRDFAVTFSTDIEGAGKVQEEFFSNASSAYDKYANRLGVFSAATSRQIRDFQQAGRGAEATKTALDEVNRGLTTYSENAGLIRRATDTISEGFSNLYSGLGRGTAVLGGDSRALGSAAAIAAAQRAGEIARAQADAERANTFIVDRSRANRTLQLNPVEREVKQNIEQAGLGDANKYKTVEERFAGVFATASKPDIGSYRKELDQRPNTPYFNNQTLKDVAERAETSMIPTPEQQKATVRRLTEDTNNIAQARALNDVSAQSTRTQQAQAQALGKTAGEAERLTTRAGLLNRATADGIPLSEANRQKIDEVSAAVGRQTQAYVEAAAKREVLFQRSQLDRTPQEQGVAASLRQVYGDQTDSVSARALAEQLRLNDSVRQTQMAYSTLGQMGSSLLDPLVDSTRSWSGAFSDLTRNMAKAALQAAVFGQGPFAGVFGTQGAGAGPGGIFGSLLSGAGLLGGGSKSSTGALQGPTQSGATLDAVAGNSVFSAIGMGIKSLLGFADGGSIRGPGSGTSDSILARVSDGEFIVRASQAQRHRGLLEAINGPGLPGFATGGSVDLWVGSVLNRYANGGSVGMSAADRIFSPTPEVGEEMVCEVEVRIAA